MQPASGFGKRGGAPAGGYAPTPPHAEPWARPDEARRSVGDACAYPFFGQAPTKLIRELQDQDICPEH